MINIKLFLEKHSFGTVSDVSERDIETIENRFINDLDEALVSAKNINSGFIEVFFNARSKTVDRIDNFPAAIEFTLERFLENDLCQVLVDVIPIDDSEDFDHVIKIKFKQHMKIVSN